MIPSISSTSNSKPPLMNTEYKLLLLFHHLPSWFSDHLPILVQRFSQTCWVVATLSFHPLPTFFPLLTKHIMSSKPVQNDPNQIQTAPLLDLPELVLDSIFEKLSAIELCSMAGVCTSLREKCSSDHLWEKHMKQKWSRVIGDAAYEEWHCYVTDKQQRRTPPSRLRSRTLRKRVNWFTTICDSSSWSFMSSSVDDDSGVKEDIGKGIMALYISLENGEFWFPAQVYNRQNGHVGFMMSCYDAKLSYDSQTDTFLARYYAGCRREEDIGWDRIRGALVQTPSILLHTSQCLNDLRPGDHVEIQWRRNKEFPYGWWYCVVGHMESCNKNEKHCCCHTNDNVRLEFKHYKEGSMWREIMINRKDHNEVGNEANGFFGGIRKLYKEEHISTWKAKWPTQILEIM